MTAGTPDNPLRVAVVGAGPAGAYAAGHLLKAEPEVRVDVFDRLPTPWGLVRAGVAPDHPKIKTVIRIYEKTAADDDVRFFGNVDVGTDVSHDELAERYHAVIYSYGAGTDRRMDIAGEDLPGSWAATEFVAWYNGHPDYRDLEFDLSCKRAAVIGNGNVAMDVARMLVLPRAELEVTDTADHAIEALAESSIEEVVILGRRGPAQAAFTNPELRELGELTDADVDVEDFELDPDSQRHLDQSGDATHRKNVEILQQFAALEPSDKRKKVSLRFLRSPVEITGDGRVEGVELAVNRLEHGGDGRIRAEATEERESLDCGLVFRSIGYKGVGIDGLPFDAWKGVVPNEEGRVIDPDAGHAVPGVYVAGWIKRGPSGVIGTNKRDAQETVEHVLDDLGGDKLPDPGESGDVADLLEERKPDFVDYAGWQAIDAAEQAAGEPQGRPRVKLTRVDEMVEAARKA